MTTPSRLTRALYLAVLLPLLAVLLGACDRNAVNARQQSGVWTIRRVTATFYDTLGTVLNTATVADAGEAAFINITGQAGSTNDEARFYLDQAVPSQVMAGLMGTGATTAPSGTVVTEWMPDDYERRRIVLRPVTDDPFRALITFVFTIADETGDTQRWLFVRSDPAADHILYREEWAVERVQ